MQHHFNTEIAKKYDIITAILLDNLFYWIEKNRANNKHFINGRYWTYNSKNAMSEMFSYLTPRQIDYATKKMKDNGLILIENHNKNKVDRTLWYAITDFGYSILQNCEMYNIYNNTNTNTNTIKETNKEKNKFIPPTLEEIQAYAKEQDRLDLADSFYTYYTATKWVDKNGKPIKSWKHKFITWTIKNAKPKTQPNSTYEVKQVNGVWKI